MSSPVKLFDEQEIQTRIEELAQEISRSVPDDFMILGLLKGSFVFIADLARALYRVDRHPEIEFMRLSSYGLEKSSAGEVHLLGDCPMDLSGRHVLLVDDIADTGRSIAYARAILEQREVARLWSCVLLDKPNRREVDVRVDFVGFTIDDVFVAGYGIDYAEKFRELPHIVVVE
jgi:hypoxanthine phosphoribosyltransferase